MKKNLKALKFVFKNIKDSNPHLSIVLVIFVLLSSQVPFISSKISANIINQLISYSKDNSIGFKSLIILALVWALVESLQSLIVRLRQYFNTVWRYKGQIALEEKFIEHTVSLDLGRIESKEFQNLTERAFRRDMFPVMEITIYFINIFAPISVIITSSIIVLSLDWKIFIVSIIPIIPQIIIERKFGQKSWGIWSAGAGLIRRKYYQNRRMLTDENASPEVRRFGATKFFKDRLYETTNKTTGELIENEKGRLKRYLLVEILNMVGFVFTIFLLISHITDGKILIGALLFYITTTNRFTSAVSDLFVGIAFQEENINLTDEIVDYFDIKPLIKTKKSERVHIENNNQAPEIEFRNVSFKYPDSDIYVLEDVSFTIKPGERVGLIGINGAGKSTIVKLLLRIYDPTGGDVFINGINLKNIEPEDCWKFMSTLMQDFNHYPSITVKESFLISNFSSKNKIDEKKILSSSEKSRADEFIKKWDKKYDAMLGKSFGGESLSKGQAQKLAIARTFYREASVMILDEPTAAIDAESEIEIFEELEKIPRTVSILYISHDMATIKKADRIMLIEDGKIVENGDHNQLMKKKGHYARIYNAQLQNLTKPTV